MPLTLEQFNKMFPHRSAYYPFLAEALDEFEINTIYRQAAFLSNLAHESARLKYMEEIASGAAYEGRKDLGNTHKGDGKRYKGRGPIQITGRANYRKAGDALGVDLEGEPELAATPEVAFRTAGWFWQTHGLNEIADGLEFVSDSEPTLKRICKRINGGYNGLNERLKYYRDFYELLVKEAKEVKPEPIKTVEDDKGVTTGTTKSEPNAEGTMPPAPAAEVKASQPSLKSTVVAIATFIMGPLSYFGIEPREIGDFAKSNIVVAAKVLVVFGFVVLAVWIWNKAMARAHERTLKVMDAAASQTQNNLRLI